MLRHDPIDRMVVLFDGKRFIHNLKIECQPDRFSPPADQKPVVIPSPETEPVSGFVESNSGDDP